jgi:hypothetical protein
MAARRYFVSDGRRVLARQEAIGRGLVDARLKQDVCLLDAAVNDAYGRCVGIGSDGRDGCCRLRSMLAVVLRQRDVFRFDDLEDVGIVENEVLQPLT